MSVRTPETLRNGMAFETIVEVTPQRPIGDLVIAVSDGLWREMTINTMIPAASDENHKSRSHRFSFGDAKPGEVFRFKIDGQINPPLFAGTSREVVALNGERRLAAVPALMDIILCASVMFFVMYLLLQLLGKRELSQVTPFELVLLVVMGDLVQQGITHNDLSMTGAALAIGTIAFWALALNWATYLSPRAERMLEACHACWSRTVN